MRAITHTMALITNSIGGTKCAPAQMPGHLRHLNPALLNRQGMSTHPKMENGSELCHWKVQLIIACQVVQAATCGSFQNVAAIDLIDQTFGSVGSDGMGVLAVKTTGSTAYTHVV